MVALLAESKAARTEPLMVVASGFQKVADSAVKKGSRKVVD